MDLTSSIIVPLLFGGLGVFALFRLLQRMRVRAYLKDAVVVITGATSGLGKGTIWGFSERKGSRTICTMIPLVGPRNKFWIHVVKTETIFN